MVLTVSQIRNTFQESRPRESNQLSDWANNGACHGSTEYDNEGSCNFNNYQGYMIAKDARYMRSQNWELSPETV